MAAVFKRSYHPTATEHPAWDQTTAHLTNEFEISWNWVKAHSTDELNNEVDLIAREAANS